jgi:hypothetical protein
MKTFNVFCHCEKSISPNIKTIDLGDVTIGNNNNNLE